MSKRSLKQFRTVSNAMLNKAGHHSIAAISVNVGIQSWGNGKVDGEINISDCHDSITLQIGYEDESERKNTLYKLNTLIKNIELAKKFVEDYPTSLVMEIYNKNKPTHQ